MTRMMSRAQQADRRREEILATALRLFADQGFHATTIADIAKATGNAHGAGRVRDGREAEHLLLGRERWNEEAGGLGTVGLVVTSGSCRSNASRSSTGHTTAWASSFPRLMSGRGAAPAASWPDRWARRPSR